MKAIKNNKIICAATYVRVSSDEQVKGYSLTFQKEENIEAIKKDGATPPEERHIYIDDGYTGINGNRPALQMMNGFYLLERASSATISNINEDQIFTGVLNNNCEVLELIDNSRNLQDKTICNGNYWPAGENQTGVGKDTIRASMERINPNISGEILKNWKTNNQININGLDAGNNPILGTPKAPNSCYLNSS